MCEKSRISKLVSLMYHVHLLVMTNHVKRRHPNEPIRLLRNFCSWPVTKRGKSQSSFESNCFAHHARHAGIPVRQSGSGKNIERS